MTGYLEVTQCPWLENPSLSIIRFAAWPPAPPPYQTLSRALPALLEHFWWLWKIDCLVFLTCHCFSELSHTNVQVRDELENKQTWPLGVSIELHPFSDGIVKSAVIKMSHGKFVHPL